MTTLILFALLGTAGYYRPQLQAPEPRRIASITYSPQSHKLTWVVERLSPQSSALSTQKYEIDLEAATMRFDGAARKFDPREAIAVLQYLAEMEEYAIASVVWWEEGKGEPLNQKAERGRQKAAGSP